MSSAAIRYQVVPEHTLREQAQRRLRGLGARAARVSERCTAVGLSVPQAPAGRYTTSAEINAACEQWETALAAMEPAIQQAQTQQRAEQISHEVATALADLARQHPAAPETERTESDTPTRPRLSTRVERLLTTLLAPAPELSRAGADVLRCTDPTRAEMLLSDLDSRIAAANATTRKAIADREQLAELRTAATELADPSTVSGLLDSAEGQLDRGLDPTAELEQARTLVAARIAHEDATRERRFVLDAVQQALTDLGYAVTPVAMDTAGSIVLTAPGSAALGVRARIVNGEIDIRTVHTGAEPEQVTLPAQAEICADLRALPDRLRAHGVVPDRFRQSGAGLAAVEVVPATATTATVRRSAVERSAEQ
ncbi:hypothetical protein [Nocardia vulneris]|uniref:Flagellar hook-length control protein-like C-terminal domain-containing protein n=1 Tax=Nocardia vulneris TaxID=1141657 RepID=A0ABR4Z9Z1_9NOCA|nr:hypothetical protein [Nocardia vulneris]KIA62150.1 hypothetical protein FG87_26520 [Nocardia vulneris]